MPKYSLAHITNELYGEWHGRMGDPVVEEEAMVVGAQAQAKGFDAVDAALRNSRARSARRACSMPRNTSAVEGCVRWKPVKSRWISP